ncbi:transcription factor s-ii central domain-containing protein [Cystoisospora suis]|uniref:Transcription factor s-ii central domain-containing protein n=1 Tax=Cystoisospora suis TaxID=483139 RepID=A0A2C6KQZ8_9APIC|nr:transcription factor s-ii central domain-containing protein [Cystoisospora suis]
MAAPVPSSSTNSYHVAVGLGGSPPPVGMPVYVTPGMFEPQCLEAAPAPAQPLHAGPPLLGIPSGMPNPALPFSSNPHAAPHPTPPAALACLQAPVQQKILTAHLDIPGVPGGLSPASLVPQAEVPIQVEDLDTSPAAPPESPSSPPSPHELMDQPEGSVDMPVCLFQLAGERFYLRDWVRLKSSGEHDWIAQIVAYIPGSNPDNHQVVDADDDTVDGGRILCRWGWDPRDLRREACPALPLQSYSRFEVIPAINFCDENPIQSIKAKVRVERFDRWRVRTSYPPLVRCPDDEDEAEKSEISSFSGVPMPSVMFYRHCHEIDTGFHPSLVADVVRFKRMVSSHPSGASSNTGATPPSPTLTGSSGGPENPGLSPPPPPNSSSTSSDSLSPEDSTPPGVSRQRSGISEDIPRYRRYPSARNPDVRHFFCCHCQGTFAPPDDVPPPPFPESELELSSSSPPTTTSQPGCLSLIASFHPALSISSTARSSGNITKTEAGASEKGSSSRGPPGSHPELQPLCVDALENSSSDEPVVVLHPVQFPFVWKRFPCEVDFVVLCWKCKSKRKRRAEKKREQSGEVSGQTNRLSSGGVVARRRRRGEDEEEEEEHARHSRSDRGQKSDKDHHAVVKVPDSHAGGGKKSSTEIARRSGSSGGGGDLSDDADGRAVERKKKREKHSRRDSESDDGGGDGQGKSSESEERDTEAGTNRDRKRSKHGDHGAEVEGWSRRRRKAASGVARAAQAAMADDSSDYETEGKNESDGDFVVSDGEVHEVIEADGEKESDIREGTKVASSTSGGGRGGEAEYRKGSQPGKRAMAPNSGKDAEALGKKSKKEKGSPTAATAALPPHGQRPRSDSGGLSTVARSTPPPAAGGGILLSSKRTNSGSGASVSSSRPGGFTDWQSGGQTRIERLAEAFRLGLKEFEESAKERTPTGVKSAASPSSGGSGSVKAEHVTGNGSHIRSTEPGGSVVNHNGDTSSTSTTAASASPYAGLRFSDAEACAKAVNAAFMAQHKGLDSRRQKQRFFELLSNLKRDNNQELRRKVLTGSISVNRLVKMESAELAPSFVRKEREEERERHFRQAILLHEAPAAALARLRKTHKGIEPVIEDPDLLQACPPLRGAAPPIVDLAQKRRTSRRPREKVRLCENSTESSSSSSTSSSDDDGSDEGSEGKGSKRNSGGSSNSSDSESSSTSSSSQSSSSDESEVDRRRTRVKKERGKGKASGANAGSQIEKENNMASAADSKGGSTSSSEIQEQLASLKRFFSKTTTGNAGDSSAEGSPTVGRGGVAGGSIDGVVPGVKSEDGEDKRGSTATGGTERKDSLSAETEGGSRYRKEKRVAFAANVRAGDGSGRKIVKSKKRRSLAFQVFEMELQRLPELLPKRVMPDAMLEKGGGKKHGGKLGSEGVGEKSDNRRPSSNNLTAPLDCSAFTPEACRDRVMRLLERVAAQGASPGANEAGEEMTSSGKHQGLLDYKAVANSMTRYLHLAFDRVTGEEHRKQGER